MKTKIEWTDYTLNPVKGLCPMACSYCYARRLYKRFKWNPEIRFTGIRLADFPEKPSRIFVGSTIELFGDWIKPEWMETILSTTSLFPQHTFIFLTKQPQNLIKWSPFPENCWVGVSVCNDKMLDAAVDKLEDIQAGIKFISFEPLLERLTLSLDYTFYYSGISWAIIGAQTPYSKKTFPQYKWVEDIVIAADRAGVPVFLKNNLNTCEISDYPILLDSKGNLRQEFPKRG